MIFEAKPKYELSDKIKIGKYMYTIYSIMENFDKETNTVIFRYGLIRKNRYIRTLDEKQIKKTKTKKRFGN